MHSLTPKPISFKEWLQNLGWIVATPFIIVGAMISDAIQRMKEK
jgi:hypothetical protein